MRGGSTCSFSALDFHPQAAELPEVESVALDYSVESLVKYFCEISLDPLTAHRTIRISDDWRQAEHKLLRFFSFGDAHPERFSQCPQVLCSSPLTGRCYWEVEFFGEVDIAVSYRSIERKGDKKMSGFGEDASSWCLRLSYWSASVIHKGREITVSSFIDSLLQRFIISRVAVFLDCPNGSLSFFRVSNGELIHLHSFKASFTQQLYAGFGFGFNGVIGSSVSLVTPRRQPF